MLKKDAGYSAPEAQEKAHRTERQDPGTRNEKAHSNLAHGS
jgi:hypothetical protein